MAPDRDQILGARLAQLQRIARQFQDAPNPPLAQKSRVEIENPPGWIGLGGFLRMWSRDHCPSVSPAVETEPTAESVPVSAEITLLHCENGASVT